MIWEAFHVESHLIFHLYSRRTHSMPRNSNDWKTRAGWLDAIAEPTRLAIIFILSTGEKTVSELARACKTEVVNVSTHLKILRAAGLVESVQDGHFRRYSLHGARAPAGVLELTHATGLRVSFPLD